MNRQRWHELADQADAIADEIGARDETARILCIRVATRLRALAHNQKQWVEDVPLPGEGEPTDARVWSSPRRDDDPVDNQ